MSAGSECGFVFNWLSMYWCSSILWYMALKTSDRSYNAVYLSNEHRPLIYVSTWFPVSSCFSLHRYIKEVWFVYIYSQ
jgi:hypothetical protein